MKPRLRRFLALGSLVLASLTGCGERPFADWGLVDPWARNSWAEDERFGPTFHTRRAELRKRRHEARSLSPDDRERTAVELAERLQNESHPVLRSEIVRTLARNPSPIAADALRNAAQDADADVRVVVCEAWAARGGEESRQMLAQILGSDTHLDVRIAAAKGLGRFKDDPQAMQSLKLALDDTNPALQHRAVESLKGMSGKDYGGDLVAWREYIDGHNPPEPPAATIADRLKSWY